MTEVRVRFAPSPTGHLHIGSARTALFNWLYARQLNGAYVLRIEDTDRQRSTVDFERTIIEDLAWLGLAWDEGPDIGGPHGPYRQTERLTIGRYGEVTQELMAAGHAYECFCSPEELEAERALALAAGWMPKYSGRCRRLSGEEKAKRVGAGPPPVVRFLVPDGRQIVFKDLIRGNMEFSTEVIGDFIIIRANGVPTYNFAAAVDDFDMKITHVLRGEDHLTNTARQLLVFDALKAQPPAFGHFSMILGADKTKLSKRHGATAVGDYRREGFLPEAVTNYLALLSWSSATGVELFDLLGLTEEFSLERVSRSPAIFDAAKLKWLNGQHIRRLQPEALMRLTKPFLSSADSEARDAFEAAGGRLGRAVEAVQTNLETLADADACVRIFINPVNDREVAARLAGPEATDIAGAFEAALAGRTDLTKDEAKDLISETSGRLKELGLKGKDIFQTMRLALTGESSGPELFLLLYTLGPTEARRRLRTAGGDR